MAGVGSCEARLGRSLHDRRITVQTWPLTISLHKLLMVHDMNEVM